MTVPADRPNCMFEGSCFARVSGKCLALAKVPKPRKGKCPFQKPQREITKGVFYPVNVTPK